VERRKTEEREREEGKGGGEQGPPLRLAYASPRGKKEKKRKKREKKKKKKGRKTPPPGLPVSPNRHTLSLTDQVSKEGEGGEGKKKKGKERKGGRVKREIFCDFLSFAAQKKRGDQGGNKKKKKREEGGGGRGKPPSGVCKTFLLPPIFLEKGEEKRRKKKEGEKRREKTRLGLSPFLQLWGRGKEKKKEREKGEEAFFTKKNLTMSSGKNYLIFLSGEREGGKKRGEKKSSPNTKGGRGRVRSWTLTTCPAVDPAP